MIQRKVFILVFILFVLVGCSSDDGISNNEGNAPETTGRENVVQEAQEVLAQENTLGNFTVLEGESFSDDRDTGVAVISLEEAAQIVAYYVWEVLGKNLEGKYMELGYNYNIHISRRTWDGIISYSQEGLEDRSDVIIQFLINAETGERITLSSWSIEPLHGISGLMMETMPVDELLEIFPEPDEAEIASMKEVVREIANRHLQNSEIVTLEYGWWTEDGTPYTTYHPSQNSPFFIIDTDGRVVEIIIQRETHLLVMINTPFLE